VSSYDRCGPIAHRVCSACLSVAVFLAVLAALPEPANARGWSIEPTPILSGYANGGLASVSCRSRAQCVAVGFGSDYAPPDPIAEIWNGKSWSPQYVGDFSDQGTPLLGVSCPATNDCVAVGYDQFNGGPLVPIAEGWNGTNWVQQNIPTPEPPGETRSRLLSVSCSAPTSCTAVGYDYDNDQPLVERFTGTDWSLQDTPVLPQGGVLVAVSCSSARRCTAVGNTDDTALAERWDGASWSVETTPVPAGAQFSSLAGVSCTLGAQCTAVGSYSRNGSVDLTLAERRSPRGWGVESTPNPSLAQHSYLAAVSCRVGRGCTAVGSDVDSSGATVTLTERRRFGAWRLGRTTNPAGATDSQLAGVACPSFANCRAVGQTDAGNGLLAEGSRLF
jgi:hypothetical protein